MSDEQFIELVKQYPVLYDVNLVTYRDHNVRNKAWQEIADQRNTSVEEVRNKWSKLRNCFTNALKRRRRKRGIAPWKFEKEMEFLLEYIERRHTDNLNDTNDDDSTHDYEFQFSEESVRSPPPNDPLPIPEISYSRASVARESTFSDARTSKNDNDNNLLKAMMDIMKTTQDMSQKRTASDMDDNDHFFLSMCKKLKSLPETEQAEIKFQIHKLIYDSEMKMLKKQ